LQLGRAAANAGGAGDDGHAVGVFELVHALLSARRGRRPRCGG
jgi:hypothetical protein